jgi:hypothetical protein
MTWIIHFEEFDTSYCWNSYYFLSLTVAHVRVGVKECPYHTVVLFSSVLICPRVAPVFIIFGLDTRFELHSLFTRVRGGERRGGERRRGRGEK